MRRTGTTRIFLLLATILCASPGSGLAAEAFVLEQTIALNDVSGRIDHLAVDLGRRRLFVAELGNGTLDVIDLASAKPIRRIKGLKEPQGVRQVVGV